VSYLVEVPVTGRGDEADTIRVEIRDVDEGLVKVARPGRVVARASRSLSEMLAGVKPVAEAFVAQFRSLAQAPDEIQVDFGITLSAEADLVVANAASEANFTVSLTWTRHGGAAAADTAG
jgi:hypothetical protein